MEFILPRCLRVRGLIFGASERFAQMCRDALGEMCVLPKVAIVVPEMLVRIKAKWTRQVPAFFVASTIRGRPW
ncbi:MAG: hypothetical protein WD063_01705 [Pirellulales bacterium]